MRSIVSGKDEGFLNNASETPNCHRNAIVTAERSALFGQPETRRKSVPVARRYIREGNKWSDTAGPVSGLLALVEAGV
jgi:hypothetical protein